MQLALLLLGGALDAVVVGVEHRHGGGGLGLAVGAGERHIGREHVDGPADHRRRHGRGAVGDGFEAAERLGAEVGCFEHPGEHGGHQEGVRHRVRLHAVDPRRRLELRQQHHHAPAVEGVEHGGEPGDVVERRGHGHAAHVLAGGGVVGAHHVAGDGAVGELHALGHGRGAAGVQQRAQAVGVDVLGHGKLERLVPGGGVGRRVVEHQDVLEVGGLGLLDQVAVARLGEQHADAAVGEQVGGFLRAGAEVHRHDGGAHERAAEDGLHALHAVGGEDAHPVAHAHAHRGEHPGGARHVVEQLLVGDLAGAAAAGLRRGVHQDDLFAGDRRRHEEQHSEIHFVPQIRFGRAARSRRRRGRYSQMSPPTRRAGHRQRHSLPTVSADDSRRRLGRSARPLTLPA